MAGYGTQIFVVEYMLIFARDAGDDFKDDTGRGFDRFAEYPRPGGQAPQLTPTVNMHAYIPDFRMKI